MEKELLDYFGGDELASTVWEKKYKFEGEKTPEDSNKRYVKEISEKEIQRLTTLSDFLNKRKHLSDYGKNRYDYLLNINNTEISTSYISEYIKKFIGFDKIIPGGSMLASIGNHKLYSSLSNCFVLGRPYDSYMGISQKTEEMSEVMKRRGGAGIDISSIRPTGAVIHNQATSSSGPVLFANRYSNVTLEIAQNGRRGALMLSIHINHPDSILFAEEKQDLTKLTGANTSIIFSDEFMQATEGKSKICGKYDFIQRFPVDVPLENFSLDFNDLEYNITYPCKYFDGKVNRTGYVRKINAKKEWNKITEYARNTAEPGIIFEDNWYQWGTDGVYEQYKPVTTNPCFSGDTPVLTDNGYFRIDSLVGKKVNVWNGKQWSEVEPQITNHNQEMLKITLSDGSIYRCTKYHNWPVWNGYSRDGYEQMTQAQYLSVGDKLSKFNLPNAIEGTKELSTEIMYTRGFYCGDGTTDRANIRLYGEKIELSQYMEGKLSINSEGFQNNIKYIDFKTTEKELSKTFIPDCSFTIKSRLDWLAGLIDADGCVDNQEGGGSCQIGSNNFEFLNELRLMLTTLGIKSRINNAKKSGFYNMPDQKGGLTSVFCKSTYRLLINAANVQKLIKLGLETHRVDFTWVNPNVRDASRFITVESIEKDGIDENVYCFTEPFEHKAIFNGFLIGQCSEIPMQPYDSCRLLSTNLYSFVKNPFTKDAYFDFDEAYKIFYEQMTLGDIIVDLEEDYIKRIIEKIEYRDSDPRELKDRVISLWDKILKSGKEGRRVGAGFTALGDTLAALGLKYNYSDKTKNILSKIFETKMRAELDATIDMSILYGSFVGFDINKEYYISDDFHSVDSGKNEMFNRMLEIFPEQINRMFKYGRRNVSWSTAAPTGSLSILSQTTSGIEPLFSPFYMRRKKVIDEKTERIDYIDPADGQKFTMFPVFHPKFKWWIENIYNPGSDATKLTEEEVNEIFKTSPWFGSCANDINWKDRVYIQSLVQKYTTHAISSTINLPNDIKADIVKNIYTESWKVGLKGNTIYRDGSRGGVLITSTNTDNKNPDSQDFDETRAPKRPIRLPAVYHTIRSKGKTYSVIIGFYQNKPYEVFIASDYDYLPQNLDDYNDCIKGEIVKEGKDWYNFESKTFILKEISDIENEEKMLSLMISMALRHRTPLKYVIKTIEKTKPFAGSFAHKLIKILSKYVPDGEESGTVCPDCGAKLRYEAGCVICPDCGWSKC